MSEAKSPPRSRTTAGEGSTRPALVTPTKPPPKLDPSKAEPSSLKSGDSKDEMAKNKDMTNIDEKADPETKPRDFAVKSLTQEELRDKWINDRQFRLNSMFQTFLPVLDLVWPELFYISPKDREYFDASAPSSPDDEVLVKMVTELLEFLDACGAYSVEELADFGDDEGLSEEDKESWVKQAVAWDSEERCQNFQSVCQMLSFVIVEDFEYIVDQLEKDKPGITGPELMALLHKELDSFKEWHLDYFKCPWNSVFLDENKRACAGDSPSCKYIIFPTGFTEEDYEKAWDAEDSKMPAKADDDKEQLKVPENAEEAGVKHGIDGDVPASKRQKDE